MNIKRAALISVSDKTGLIELAKSLTDAGLELLVTSGSGAYLKENGISVHSIEDYTGQKEILDGRVKTLHPKIHAGLLAKRDNPQHIQQLVEDDIMLIDIAVVNLYPFIENIHKNGGDPKKMVELVDIGGPTMIRAAAKNFSSVVALLDPRDYTRVIELLPKDGNSYKVIESIPLSMRKELSTKVFAWLSNYNGEIARYFSSVGVDGNDLIPTIDELPDTQSIVLTKSQTLRYGENPHQKAIFYNVLLAADSPWKQLQGKELSYNNLLDLDAAVRLLAACQGDKSVAAILKHLNPCGAAIAETLLEALRRAKQGDPRSHFGGILAFNRVVEREVAEGVAEDFAEIVVAPSYTNEALNIFSQKKNLRVIQINLEKLPRFEYRSVIGGMLVQEIERQVSRVSEAEVVSDRKPIASEIRDLQFAWDLCAHVKSNAITIVKDLMLVAAGAGQMSRIDATEVAISKAKTHKNSLNGAVAASDAFFPFSDCLEALAAEGVSAIISPRGAKRDGDSIAAANKLGVSLLFTGDRHFRH